MSLLDELEMEENENKIAKNSDGFPIANVETILKGTVTSNFDEK